MTKRPFTYTVLRYVHDPLSAEFVNVGIVLLCPAKRDEAPILKSEFRKTVGRMRHMFPDLDLDAFRTGMRTISDQLQRLGERIGDISLFTTDDDASTYARRVLPNDDTSLQWSPIGSGLTDDVETTFERLYARFVLRYDAEKPARRSDEDVWRPIRERIVAKVPGLTLAPHRVVGEDDSVDFRNAWKNGAWHVYEPVSLDLTDAKEIDRKAYRWLGQMTSLGQTPERFQANFLVGAPSDPDLQPAYRHALHVLGKPSNVKVFEETEAESLVEQIEKDVNLHALGD